MVDISFDDLIPKKAPTGGGDISFDDLIPKKPSLSDDVAGMLAKLRGGSPAAPARAGEPGAPSVPISTGDGYAPPPAPPKPYEQMSPEEKAQSLRESIQQKRAQVEAERPSLFPKGLRAPIDDVSARAVDTASRSVVRPAVSALSAGLSGNQYPGSTFGERFGANMAIERENAADVEKRLGKAAMPIDVAASLLTTKTPTSIASTPRLMGRAFTEGAVQGAAQNADKSPSEILAEGGKQGLQNAGAALVLNKVANALPAAKRGYAAEAQAAKGIPPEENAAAAKALYKQLDESGVAFDGNQMRSIRQGIRDELKAGGYSPKGAHEPLVGIVDDLNRLTRRAATYNQIDELRGRIATEMRSQDANVRQMAGRLASQLDSIVHTQTPAVNPKNLPVSDLVTDARRLYRAKSLTEDTGWIADKAERRSAVSGTDPAKANSAAFKTVLDRGSKPGAYDPLSDSRDELSRIVFGDKAQQRYTRWGDRFTGPIANAGSWAGRAMGGGLGWRTSGEPVAAGLFSTAGDVIGRGIPTYIGTKLKEAAATRSDEAVNALLRKVSGGRGTGMTRDDLAAILMGQKAVRAGARVPWVNQEEQK